MKSYIADTLIGIFAFDETGNILNFIDFDDDYEKIIEFYNALESDIIHKVFENFLLELKNSGSDEFIFDNKKLESLTSEKFALKTFFEKRSIEFKAFRSNLETNLKKIGINKTSEEILIQYKKVSEELSRKKVSRASGHSDNVITQIITVLEVIKKSLSLFSSHLREWYGLHFPELTDKIIEENIILAELVSTLGSRENFTFENIDKIFDLKESKIKALEQYALESMGANIDLNILQNYAEQIISLDTYRQQLENYLEALMEENAPNVNTLIGSLIGAKLIAKAGGLQKLAYMPASRIQLLGAEKALYRFLKTGEKRPKHGLIFQWNQIRSAKPYHRGKIARVVAGKVGLAAKVDFFNGEFMGEVLSKEIDKKIKEIEKKYPNPPKKAQSVKSQKKKTKKRK
ncbi:MAG: C/D box methylation guide ribonucleoprotein complex aNOP56 subunit [Candidatus Lokiarchaeota archaeon]|nr:C/D box methylation guide ribonucleoprotein complex aNOP56 subunit [Candidatus Lokiarchaeota archaeon]